MKSVKRFNKHEVIYSAEVSGVEVGFKAGAKVTWVVWDDETDRPVMVEKHNGKLTLESYGQKKTAEMVAEFYNSN